ncbi:hypothetical protein C8046_16915 [Serinibacter arcticus]|uniref:N-acetyl-1-D-myo-inosityl-2-amino-2-deoxy-alpha-D-glucopyranoside deacetylase MshB n=1 Tax=Serinibacter arcticus TaxID=1655435 RepID=A0A2U1ZYK7_9MICO|nr:hypothetical protein [Serinibacter arcticus]PWD52078.1 hypothetical protein C8046_16915 [Serinibacter arcticus]
MRDVRPAVVISDEAGGSYGHPDHRRTHAIVVRALDLAAQEGPGTRGTPLAGVQPVHAAVAVAEDRLRAANASVTEQVRGLGPLGALAQPLLVPGTDLPSLAVPAEGVDLEVDTTSVAPAVLAALRAYRSQVQGSTIPVLDTPLQQRRATDQLTPDQAAIGWYALSNDVAQPILPVVGLVVVRGDAARLRDALAGLPALARPGTDGAAPASPVAAPDVQPLMTPPSAGRIAAVVSCLVLGVLVGVVTTVVHRWRLGDLPLGMLLALVTIGAGALLSRAVTRGAGLLGFAVGAVGAIQAMAFLVAGGDVLVPGDTLGMVWLLGSVLAIGVAAFLPDRWVGRHRDRGAEAARP